MLDSHLLHTVATVIREGSFERAAAALSLTPSAVSQRVRQLEERVGTVLIVRGQPCTPTELGARLCRHADTVGLLEQDLLKAVPTLGGARSLGAAATRTRLRIAVNADSVDTWFVDALARFAQASDALVDVQIDDQDQTADWLRRGQVLAAVTADAAPVQGCRSRRLGALRYRATANPDFMARWFGGGVDAEHLAQAPCLSFGAHDQLQQRWVRRVTRRTLALPTHRLPSPQAYRDATLRGIGWGMNPEPLVAAALADGRAVDLMPDRPLDVPLHWQSAKLPLPALQALTEAVLAAAQLGLQAAQPPR